MQVLGRTRYLAGNIVFLMPCKPYHFWNTFRNMSCAYVKESSDRHIFSFCWSDFVLRKKRSKDDVMFLQLLSATFEIVPCSLCLIYPIKPRDACFLSVPLKVSIENIQFTQSISSVLKSEEHFCSQTGKQLPVVPLSKRDKCHMKRLGEVKSFR